MRPAYSLAIALALLAACAGPAAAAEPFAGLLMQADGPPPRRDPAVKLAFRAAMPCPATGRRVGRCDGWEIDHTRPLCDGGADELANLQWLTVSEHRQKTRSDVAACRRGVPAPIWD